MGTKFLFFKILYYLCYYNCPNFPHVPLHPGHLPTSTVNPHTIVHVHGSFTHVLCLVPSPPSTIIPLLLPLWSLSVCSLFQCGSILFISLFCSSDTSYRWGHMVFVFHQLALFYLASYSPVPSMLLQKVGAPPFFLLSSISLCKCSLFFDPLISWWAFRLFPAFHYCKYYHYEHRGV